MSEQKTTVTDDAGREYLARCERMEVLIAELRREMADLHDSRNEALADAEIAERDLAEAHVKIERLREARLREAITHVVAVSPGTPEAVKQYLSRALDVAQEPLGDLPSGAAQDAVRLLQDANQLLDQIGAAAADPGAPSPLASRIARYALDAELAIKSHRNRFSVERVILARQTLGAAFLLLVGFDRAIQLGSPEGAHLIAKASRLLADLVRVEQGDEAYMRVLEASGPDGS